MKKIVPFKRNLAFKTNLSEITSISLEHTLQLKENNLITGNFILTGDYKIADSSISTEPFKFELPFDINIDDKYITDNVIVDIDDFYYEIENNKSLVVNIDVLIDKLEEKPLIKEIIEQKEMVLDPKQLETPVEVERCVEEEDFPFKELDTSVKLDEKLDAVEQNKSIFDSFDDDKETYSTYRVYIMRENDTIESVMQKYSITKEEIEAYNDLNDVKIGDKLILPNINAKV